MTSRSARRTPLLITLFGVLALVGSVWFDPSYRLIYNPSASAPLGWYVLVPARDLQVHDWVLARLPHAIAAFAAAREYLPLRVPILKPIGAGAGQKVCEEDGEVVIDGRTVAHALRRDGAGRPLPHWAGCRTLEDGELFLFSPHSAASFDGRYFGPVRREAVIGKAIPLWTW